MTEPSYEQSEALEGKPIKPLSELKEEKGWVNIGDARLEIPHESRSLRLRINIQEKVNDKYKRKNLSTRL